MTREVVARVRRLSDRERQVVVLLSEGLILKEVAVRLGLSFESAKAYAKRARRACGAKTNPHMIRILFGDTTGIPDDTTGMGEKFSTDG